MNIFPVIMCGGAGTSMWPESRADLPKPFLRLIGKRSTFQSTAAMLASSSAFQRPIILCHEDHRFLVSEQLAQIGVLADIVLEPVRRGSGPAVGVAAELAFMRDPDAIVFVLSADHVVAKPQDLVRLCEQAARMAARGRIVTLGVTPDLAMAQSCVEESYLRSSGGLVFSARTMRDEIAQFEPAMAQACAAAVADAMTDLQFCVLDKGALEQAPGTSIDDAVMARTARAAVIPADIGWSDVGDWSAVRALSPQDLKGNAVTGDAVLLDASNCLVRADGVLTAVVGLTEVIVIVTPDAVLVASADEAERVKDIVAELTRLKRPEAQAHTRVHRPWGYYQRLDAGERHQVKRIVVQPGGRLSLQKHHHRAEHWIVVRGAAEVVVDDEMRLVHENESIYLPMGCLHRLANPGKIALELIEVQTGSYLGEDDIIRVEDAYNRV
ncbi:MAG: mannose-phosphate guanylyltransferase/mannose-6-phosphate isomerase [Hyphomicrobiales bacterium]|nr:mannose-phosphate guanylyltransferase/mannose-6-phosphate isomerase [Hyphomicrobiales bacterium]